MPDVTNTPNLPPQPPNQPGIWVPAALQKELTWIQKHEKLLIVVLVLIVLFFGLNHYLNNAAEDAKLRATVAEQALASAKANSAENALQTAQVAQQYQSIVEALTRQNASLAASVAARQVVLAQTQAVNQTLPVPELGKKMQVLANIGDSDISASTAGLTLTQRGAVAAVNTLEQVPVLQADLADTVKRAGNLETEITAANGLIAVQGTHILGLGVEIAAADKACKTEIASVKAEARKSKWKWFKAGSAVTAVAGVLIKVLIF